MPPLLLPPFLDPCDAPNGLTRRRFLKLGLALPLFSLTLMLPFPLLAATGKTPGKKPQPTGRAKPLKKPRAPRLLMIDPGHGGHDPGAIGKSGVQEKDITLDIARHMASALAGRTDVNVKLTRAADAFLSLTERVQRGRDARADLFVSVHADSAPNKAARGLSVYTLSEKASDEFAYEIAEKENHADVVGGVDLSQADQEVAGILFDLAARRARNTAQRTKVNFVRAMGRRWQLLDRPMRAANFAVLRSPDVPSMLVETGFLSNPKDEKILRQSKQRQKIAQIMAKEIAALLNGPLFGT